MRGGGVYLLVVRGERAEVGPVPRIVEGIAGISGVSANFQFILLSLRVELETGIFSVPVSITSN